MQKKLEVKNLQISFRTQGGNVKAVRDISFDLYKGETLAIVGESGSGKSVTSKAIIGILAGNSIIEGGEILYDGHDLLKISEEDFHKIRGDKIAMIFQDPMSSLNPIMRIGQQMTEAMILKGKMSQKKSKKEFNDKLALLNKAIDEVSGDNQEEKASNALKCKKFDEFVIKSCLLEQEYNEAFNSTVDLQLKVDDVLFLMSKNQKVDLVKSLKEIKKILERTIHPYVISISESANVMDKLNRYTRLERLSLNQDVFLELVNELKTIVDLASKKEKLNYFTLGYYVLNNPEFDATKMAVDQVNVLTRQYLDENFMLDFIATASKGVKHSYDMSIQNKKELLSLTESYLEYFRSEGTLDKKETYAKIKDLGALVSSAIDKLSIVKKSIEYSFYPALKHNVDSYFHGVEQNPINQAKYEKQLAKFNSLVENGKNPTWKVIPPVLVDLELEKKNVRHILHSLRQSIREDLAAYESFDVNVKTVDLIDYLKELASKAVYNVTPKMAKAKALKLLEEVGIPEPQIRFRQYPFQFSGGMRQRIVIAIALSANPDILICDEPTTALDVTIQSQILELINKIKVERNLSVIFITHDLGVVANMADRIAVMYAGKIVEYGTSEDVFYDPRHPYTWALLSSMPDLETKEKLEAIPGTPPNMIYPPKGDAFAERNKYAMEIDFEEQPPLFEISDTHYAATWLLHPNAPKVNPPKIITDRIERMKKAGAK